MHNKAKACVKVGCLVLCFASSFSLNAKALRSPVQTGDHIIVAKGDIPTPPKYHSATQAAIANTTDTIERLLSQLNHIKVALAANDWSQAQESYIRAHQDYEQVRPIIHLFGKTDRVINARADDFPQGVSDYRFKGFHLVEYHLFKTNDKSAAISAVDELIMYTQDLKQRVEQEHIAIPKLVQSSADFIEMIIEVKLAGKENQYSHSDIADMAANMAGSQQVIDEITAFIPPQTLTPILTNYQHIDALIAQYATPSGGYLPYDALTQHDKQKLYSLLSDQAFMLATLRATLDVDVYYTF